MHERGGEIKKKKVNEKNEFHSHLWPLLDPWGDLVWMTVKEQVKLFEIHDREEMRKNAIVDANERWNVRMGLIHGRRIRLWLEGRIGIVPGSLAWQECFVWGKRDEMFRRYL